MTFADALVCCNNEQRFISIDIADVKILSIKEKDLTNCLEGPRQGGSSYRW